MAHPFLKISNNKTDYFVVWDTYYELPLSIPMDLATFIMFLHEKKWTFTGLIASWNNLKNNNISLEGFVLNKYLKKNQYDFLLKQAEDEYVISKEINYREYSNLISSKLDTLFLKYQQKTINSSNEESKLLLAELHEEFYLYFNNDFCHNISLLPLHLYDNINSTCDKLYSQISSDKLNDFHNFLFSTQPNELDALRAANWFSRQLFYYGLL